jgi:hypothetical protein
VYLAHALVDKQIIVLPVLLNFPGWLSSVIQITNGGRKTLICHIMQVCFEACVFEVVCLFTYFAIAPRCPTRTFKGLSAHPFGLILPKTHAKNDDSKMLGVCFVNELFQQKKMAAVATSQTVYACNI